MLNRRNFISYSSLALASGALAQNSSSKQPIKIAQIGTGHAHAGGKMEVYRASKEFDVVGVFEPDEQRRKRVEGKGVYKDIPFMTLEQLLNVKGLQAVAVETEVKDLLKYADICINAGLHIHLDKPAGSHLPTYKKILDKADQKKCFIQLGYMYRFNPAVMFMMDILKKGWLGTPFSVHTVMGKVLGSSTRKELSEYPGGIMFELGCHVIDLTVSALGKPEKVTAFPQSAKSSHDDGYLDNMLAVFEYKNANASVRSLGMEVEGFARRHFVLCGTEGTCHIQPLDRPSIKLALSKPRDKYRKGYQEINYGPYKRYVGDATDFAAMIRGEKGNDFPSSHEFAVQQAVLLASGLKSD